MNERLKILRKNLLNMSQEAFGERIGLTKAAVSRAEAGLNGISEMAFKAICREYNVRAEWLRDGTGEPFQELSTDDELEHLSRQFAGDLPDSFRRRLVHALAQLTDEQWKMLADISDMLVETDRPDHTNNAEAAYIKRISNTVPSTDTTASNTTDGSERNGTD